VRNQVADRVYSKILKPFLYLGFYVKCHVKVTLAYTPRNENVERSLAHGLHLQNAFLLPDTIPAKALVIGY